MVELPDWFDPDRDAMLGPTALRGLVHPIRLRLLELLQQDGPATASGLGREIGQSSGVTSYHLRVLAEHGFVTDDAERGTGRDRYLKAVYRTTSFTFRLPEDPGTPETVDDASLFMRLVAEAAHRRVLDYVDSFASRQDELAQLPWGTDEYPVRLTLAEARALRTRIAELVMAFRREQGDPDPRRDTTRAWVQVQFLPDER